MPNDEPLNSGINMFLVGLILNVKTTFLNFESFFLNDGNQIRF